MDWPKYLHWDALQETLSGDKQPDLGLLTGIHTSDTSTDYEGLGIGVFLDVQHALHNYIATIGGVSGPAGARPPPKSARQVGRNLDAYKAKPTTENALVIGDRGAGSKAHQVPELVQAIQHHFVQPN